MLKDLNYLDNNAKIMQQQEENVSDYKTSKKRKQSSSTKPIHPSKQMRQNPKIMITLLIGNRMEMVQRAAGKPAAYFLFVVLIMAEFLMAKLEYMVVAFFEAWRRAVGDFF